MTSSPTIGGTEGRKDEVYSLGNLEAAEEDDDMSQSNNSTTCITTEGELQVGLSTVICEFLAVHSIAARSSFRF